MIGYGSFHEEEVVTLSGATRSCRDLWNLLKESQFSLQDDVFVLERRDKVKPWQHDAIVEVEILRDGREVFDEAEAWDTLNAVYSLARLPDSCVPVFVEVVSALAKKLQIEPRHRDHVVSRDDLLRIFQGYAEELRSTLGQPGSEEVAILIESTYPR